MLVQVLVASYPWLVGKWSMLKAEANTLIPEAWNSLMRLIWMSWFVAPY